MAVKELQSQQQTIKVANKRMNEVKITIATLSHTGTILPIPLQPKFGWGVSVCEVQHCHQRLGAIV